MKKTHQGIGLLSLGVLLSVGGYFWIITSYHCLWSCSPAQETAGIAVLVGIFAGLLIMLIGATLYQHGKSPP